MKAGSAVVAFGLHAVRHALGEGNADSLAHSMLLVQAGRDDKRLQEIVTLAQSLAVPVSVRERSELDRVAGGRHQGAVLTGVERRKDENDLESLLANRTDSLLLLVLDGVQDPHNLGACLRSADAAGADAIVVPRRRAAGMGATVRKVAAGAAEHVPVIAVANLARALKFMAGEGVRLIGTASEAEKTFFEADLTGPVAIVMGSEERGLRRLTRENCDELVSLPMAGAVESLNVSVAAGILLFEVVRQRRCSGEPGAL